MCVHIHTLVVCTYKGMNADGLQKPFCYPFMSESAPVFNVASQDA